MQSKQTLLEEIAEKDFVKKGEYTLKSGEISSIYLDFRKIISHPLLLSSITDLLVEYSTPLLFDRVLGVPYGALSLSTCFSLKTSTPQLLCRKEPKNYGTKQRIEGDFHVGERCLVIEDVVNRAESVMQTVILLREMGILVTDVICLVDRETTGRKALKDEGIILHHLFTLKEITNICQELQPH